MGIKLSAYISKRFASSSKRRFLSFARIIAFLGVALGTIALIMSLSILDGFENELKKSSISFTSHINVTKINTKPISDYSFYQSRLIKEFPQIESVSPVIEREALIKSKFNVEGVLIKGIDHNADISGITTKLYQGTFNFDTSTVKKQVVLGKALADKMTVKVGDDIALYVLKGSASEISDYNVSKFEVIGIYQTGMMQYDDVLIYMPLNKLSAFIKYPDNSCSKFEIKLKNLDNINKISSKIMDKMGFPYYTMTYYELHSSIFSWIELQKEPIPLVLGLISMVAVLNIITTLLITVVEKTHSIGILRTLGIKRRDLLFSFIHQGMMIGISGAFVGAALALIFCYLQQNYGLISLDGEIYFLNKLPVTINYIHYLVVISGSIILSFISTILPAWIALKISPIKAIKFI